MAKKAAPKGQKKKAKKNVSHAVVHIRATFNNTIVTISDPGPASSGSGPPSTPVPQGPQPARASSAKQHNLDNRIGTAPSPTLGDAPSSVLYKTTAGGAREERIAP